ncbi:hypothetical protein M3152_14455 [Sporosarcina luteola]|uniref:hypothetical protein n=1 Tax=Bacillales TaxID=1385 RepID=UPI0020422BD5|nr:MULTISPECIES: hypothetical protein [Bacillales]MCM3638901.1 hypothetical protein [Sporosarcina luteola]
MKKIYIGALLILLIATSTVFYHQHQVIIDYRASIYGELAIIQKPIERILEYQETAEKYDDAQRAQLIETLFNAFADVYNSTGGIVRAERQIEEQYLNEYLDTKKQYVQIVIAYEEATTSQEREQAHKRLLEHYKVYEEFLKKVEKEFVEPF